MDDKKIRNRVSYRMWKEIHNIIKNGNPNASLRLLDVLFNKHRFFSTATQSQFANESLELYLKDITPKPDLKPLRIDYPMTGFVVINDIEEIAYKTSMYPENPSDNTLIPVFYKTYEEGMKEIADDMIAVLQQFIDDERDLEDTDFGTNDDVAYAEMFADGTIKVYYADSEAISTTTPLFETSIKELSS